MIYYLSCTGNTYWAAKQLADATNDRMVSIFDAIEEGCICNLRDGERLGFCLPVHGWRVQPIVEKFIQQLNINSPKIKNESITDKKKHCKSMRKKTTLNMLQSLKKMKAEKIFRIVKSG